MFGKIFESMFTGSMVGKGSPFFAVWAYVIAHAVPDSKVGTQVELNPAIIGFLLGEPVETVERVLREMQEPDLKSRTQDEQGRKLVPLGGYSYRVVNGAKYRAMRDQAARREQNRRAQAVFRDKKVLKRSQLGPGEAAGTARLEAGDEAGAARIADDLVAARARAVPPGATVIPPVMPRVPGRGLPLMPPTVPPTPQLPPLDGPDL